MINLIRQPINVFPNNTIIDGTKPIEFSFTYSGDILQNYCYLDFNDGLNFTKISLDKNIFNGDTVSYIKEDGYNYSIYNDYYYYYHFTLDDFKNNYNQYIQQYDLQRMILKSNADYNKESNTTIIKVDVETNLLGDYYDRSLSSLIDEGLFYLGLRSEGNVTEQSIIEVKKILSIEDAGSSTVTDDDGNKTTTYYKNITIESSFNYDITTNSRLYVYSSFFTTVPYTFNLRKTPTIDTLITFEDENSTTTKESYLTNKTSNLKFTAEVDIKFQTIKYYLFNIYNADNNVLFDTSGKIFNSNINYVINNLINGNYYVELIITTNYNQIVKSDKQYFTIEYPTPNINLPPKLEIDYVNQAINVSWAKNKQSFPIVNGTNAINKNYPCIGFNSVHTEKDSSLTYTAVNNNPLSIDENNNFTLLVKINLAKFFDYYEDNNLTDGSTVNIVSLIDSITNHNYIISYNYDGINGNFVAVKNGVETLITVENKNDGKPINYYYDYFLIVIKPNPSDIKIYPMNYQFIWSDLDNVDVDWNVWDEKVTSWKEFERLNLFKDL